MAKDSKSIFFCQECGHESAKWMGQCPGCREWNTFVEETVSKNEIKNSAGVLKRSVKETEVALLSEIQVTEENRILTGIG